MKSSAVLPQSVLDYPGKLCSVIFVSLCNFRCGFCHNPAMVESDLNVISEEEILKLLKDQYSFIDAVTITGGEPTLQPDLLPFCLKLKKIGLFVKVDTNGSHPEVLSDLLANNAVDYIAMDIKAPLSKYKSAVNVQIDEGTIAASIKLLLEGKVEYEFRTTVVPTLVTEADIEEMAKVIKGARLYALQQYNNAVVLDKAYKYVKPYSVETLEKFKKIVDNYVQRSVLRGVDVSYTAYNI